MQIAYAFEVIHGFGGQYVTYIIQLVVITRLLGFRLPDNSWSRQCAPIIINLMYVRTNKLCVCRVTVCAFAFVFEQTKRFLRADSDVLIFTLNDYSARLRYMRTDTRARNVLDNACACVVVYTVRSKRRKNNKKKKKRWNNK